LAFIVAYFHINSYLPNSWVGNDFGHGWYFLCTACIKAWLRLHLGFAGLHCVIASSLALGLMSIAAFDDAAAAAVRAQARQSPLAAR